MHAIGEFGVFTASGDSIDSGTAGIDVTSADATVTGNVIESGTGSVDGGLLVLEARSPGATAPVVEGNTVTSPAVLSTYEVYSSALNFVQLLPMLTTVVPFGATGAGAPLLAAARSLPDAGRKRVRAADVDGSLVTGSWRRLVFSTLTCLPGPSTTGPTRCASWSSSTGR